MGVEHYQHVDLLGLGLVVHHSRFLLFLLPALFLLWSCADEAWVAKNCCV